MWLIPQKFGPAFLGNHRDRADGKFLRFRKYLRKIDKGENRSDFGDAVTLTLTLAVKSAVGSALCFDFAHQSI